MTAELSTSRERATLATPPVCPANDEQPTAGSVLDVDEVARLLRIGRNTIYELVARNEIPHRRCGKQIRFSRAAIMRWLDSCGRAAVQKAQ